MKILVAPNALKGSVSAVEAAERISRGLKKSGLDAILDLMPIADGGDDTMDVLVASGGEVHEVEVLDPLRRPNPLAIRAARGWPYSCCGNGAGIRAKALEIF